MLSLHTFQDADLGAAISLGQLAFRLVCGAVSLHALDARRRVLSSNPFNECKPLVVDDHRAKLVSAIRIRAV